eukprot:11184243-Alexandrium_andersonii.AAC.1
MSVGARMLQRRAPKAPGLAQRGVSEFRLFRVAEKAVWPVGRAGTAASSAAGCVEGLTSARWPGDR